MLPALSMAAPALVGRGGGGGEIVGGTAAAAGEFPYIVAIETSGGDFCGGVLLSANTVITAAHCSVDTTPSGTTVRAGSLVS
jgi:trypsin